MMAQHATELCALANACSDGNKMRVQVPAAGVNPLSGCTSQCMLWTGMQPCVIPCSVVTLISVHWLVVQGMICCCQVPAADVNVLVGGPQLACCGLTERDCGMQPRAI